MLGDPELRAEYDDVVARLRAANLPVPQIGRAIVVAPLPPRWGMRFGRAIGGAAASTASVGAAAAMAMGKVVLPLGFIGLVCAGILSPSHKTTSPSYEYKPPMSTQPVFQSDYSTSKLLDEKLKRDLDAIKQRYSQPSLLLPHDPAKVDFSKLFPDRDKPAPGFDASDLSKILSGQPDRRDFSKLFSADRDKPAPTFQLPDLSKTGFVKPVETAPAKPEPLQWPLDPARRAIEAGKPPPTAPAAPPSN